MYNTADNNCFVQMYFMLNLWIVIYSVIVVLVVMFIT